NIINALQSLDKTYSNSELVRKILRCLPRSWLPKVTAIEEAKNLSILPLEDLLGSLMTHELTMQKRVDDEVKEKKKKNVFLANKKKFCGKLNKKFHHKGESCKKEEVVCYECNKPGHYKSDCPRLKKKEFMKKKKAMVATWDDSDESSSDEDTREQVAQLALMAFEEEEEEEYEEVTYDELIIMCEKYNAMIVSLKKMVRTLTNENYELKTIDLTKEINSKDVEIDFLENEVAHLEEENKNLKVEVDALKKSFSKFSSSSEKLDNLL
ncbi:zf-CCHC domain-containing protein/UBN2 domain-containing protein, partial [Cephalotus follicularis]